MTARPLPLEPAAGAAALLGGTGGRSVVRILCRFEHEQEGMVEVHAAPVKTLGRMREKLAE